MPRQTIAKNPATMRAHHGIGSLVTKPATPPIVHVPSGAGWSGVGIGVGLGVAEGAGTGADPRFCGSGVVWTCQSAALSFVSTTFPPAPHLRV